MQVLDGHISSSLNNTRDLFILFMLVNNFHCQLLLFDNYLIHCSIFIQCFVFIIHFIVHPVKYSVLILEFIPGISIPTTTIIKRVNKHHTSDLCLNIGASGSLPS
jgi:hypothetical protein